METIQQAQNSSDRRSETRIDLWEPDEFYMEWLIFLAEIWEKFEYL